MNVEIYRKEYCML